MGYKCTETMVLPGLFNTGTSQCRVQRPAHDQSALSRLEQLVCLQQDLRGRNPDQDQARVSTSEPELQHLLLSVHSSS